MNGTEISLGLSLVDWGLIGLGFALALLLLPWVAGAVFIREQQVGVVIKKFGRGALPPGRLLALGGEPGYQADTLPPGLHLGNWPWQYRIIKSLVTVIPQGEIGLVGVVISFVGMAHEDVSGTAFKHGDLVNTGHKGVWVTPLYPGKHPLNTRIMKVERVPTTNIVLNWANRTEAHNYDAKLSPITVRSSDGFGFSLDVSQSLHTPG